MIKLLKKTLFSVAFILAVCVVITAFLPKMLDINDYKSEILDLIKEETGYDIVILGKAKLDLFPQVSVELNDVAYNMDGGNKLKAKSLLVSIDVMNLLVNREVDIKDILLDEPHIVYHTASSQETNTTTSTAVNQGDTESQMAEFTIKNLKLVSARIELVHENARYVIENFNLDTSFKAGENPFSSSGKLKMVNGNLGVFKMHSRYMLSTGKLQIKDALISLDDTNISAQATFDYGKDVPQLDFALKLSDLDLDQYQIGSFAVTKPQAKANPTSKKKNINRPKQVNKGGDIDLSFMGKLNLFCSISGRKLSYKGFTLDNYYISAYSRDERLMVDLKDVVLYGGRAEAKFELGKKKGRISHLLEVKSIKDVDLSRLPNKYSSKFEGILNASGYLASSGDKINKIIANLNGKAGVSFSDGRVKGLEMASVITNLTTLVRTMGKIKKATEYEYINADFDIINGVISNDNMRLKSPFLNLKGRGTLNVKTMKVDYKVTPLSTIISKIPKFVPIRIVGDISKPQFIPEVKSPPVGKILNKGRKAVDGGVNSIIREGVKLLQGF